MKARFTAFHAKDEPHLAGYARLAELELPYVEGFLEVKGRSIPRISTRLSPRDRLGGLAVRWNIGRNRYRVMPGLYAVGSPSAQSPVLVSANYKLSFDALRRELSGLDAWILVLDTKSVNVWCAAGKGSFGTAELLSKLSRTRLDELVAHRVLILPQLAASGVCAPEVARLSAFRVVYGPVLAKDIPAFLEAGMKKSQAMRLVPFGLKERMAVAPVELAQAWPFVLASLALALLCALPASAGFLSRLWPWVLALLGSVLVGALAFPALLPYLPFQAFSLKGAVLGLVWGGVSEALLASSAGPRFGWALALAFLLVSTPVTAFIAMGFTGSSTYTSQSGTAAEVERGLPIMAIALGLGLCLGLASRIFAF
jgi:hypothetical protein